MKILVAHPGTPPHAQQAVRAYLEAGFLDRFLTTFVYQPSTFSGKLAKTAFGALSRDADRQLRRRSLEGIPAGKVATHPFREIVRTLSTRFASPSVQDWVWDWMEREFDRHVAGSDWAGSVALHGYEYACLRSFEKARQSGVATIYEMPAPFFRAVSGILSAEYKRFPELATDAWRELEKRAPNRNLRKRRELGLATLVLCNSAFTRTSVLEEGFPEERIITLPLGMPPPVEAERAGDGPLVFLYAGTLSVRKGVHYLLNAWRRLSPPPDVELRLVGAVDIPRSLLGGLPGNVTLNGSVSKAELSRHYREASLLLFPTLCDGFGMVLTEALAHGLPVLTTTGAGASTFIQHGVNGFVVTPASVEELLETMRWCVRNRDVLQRMRAACLETARRWQWADYRRELAAEVSRKLSAL